MSDNKYTENDPERTLITLDQLSQTIEVMTSVVNRLRQHLSEQLKAQMEAEEEAGLEPSAQPEEPQKAEAENKKSQSAQQKRESFVVEISQQESEPVRKNNKTLH